MKTHPIPSQSLMFYAAGKDDGMEEEDGRVRKEWRASLWIEHTILVDISLVSLCVLLRSIEYH